MFIVFLDGEIFFQRYLLSKGVLNHCKKINHLYSTTKFRNRDSQLFIYNKLLKVPKGNTCIYLSPSFLGTYSSLCSLSIKRINTHRLLNQIFYASRKKLMDLLCAL